MDKPDCLTGKCSSDVQLTAHRGLTMDNQNQNQNISLEQEFQVQSFARQVETISKEEAKELLVDLYKSTIIRENLFREIIKESWGIDKSITEALEIG
ncbi:MAG: NblA/ycf18 family protein [Lyngbya sp.]|nr:NblA/ycf18 family protein [Lyngbya sp.]